MKTTRVIDVGNTQAIVIPQELRTPYREFFVEKLGETYIFCPTDGQPVMVPWPMPKSPSSVAQRRRNSSRGVNPTVGCWGQPTKNARDRVP